MELTIPEWLQFIRPDCSASELAQQTGVQRATLDVWLRGKAVPTNVLWARFMRGAGLSEEAVRQGWDIWKEAQRKAGEGAL